MNQSIEEGDNYALFIYVPISHLCTVGSQNA